MAVVLLLSILSLGAVAGDGVLAMKTVGAVPSELSLRVKDWVAENLGPVQSCGASVTSQKNLDAIAKEISQTHTNRGVVLIALVDQPSRDSRVSCDVGGAVAINLRALALPDMGTAEAKEKFARRVEKEAISGAARHLGMPPCPFLYCALYEAAGLEELDVKARVLCPPCSGKLPGMIRKYQARKNLPDR